MAATDTKRSFTIWGKRMESITHMARSRSTTRPVILAIAVSVAFFVVLSSAWGQSDDEQTAKDLVSSFLIALGEGDLDAIPEMFVSNANIGTVSLREGKWVASTKTFEEWFGELKVRTTWTRFREPVTKFTVHIEDDQMAFVRADATVIVDDVARSHNIDYFTLVREEGSWKFLSASYVAKPIISD